MSDSIYYPYTYLIGWTTIEKFYYGVEYAHVKKIANPNNLWNTYFTSSKIVKHFREVFGEPDIIQIRKVFRSGTIEERMNGAIEWEKKVLRRINITQNKWLNGRIGGNICPEANRSTNISRYGVENVFAADEIKDIIKNTLIEKYGVDHPSKSSELMEKKKKNNFQKYGIEHTISLPHIREKCIQNSQSTSARVKRINTNIEKYGCINPASSDVIKEKMLSTRKKLSERHIVKHIKEYKRLFKYTLSSGWYQSSDDKLNTILQSLYEQFGTYSLEELCNIKSF